MRPSFKIAELINGSPITAAERAARRIGLGSAIKAVTTAIGIKPCGGCKRRAVALDAIIPNINPLAKD